MYFIYGDENYLINEKINEIIQNNKNKFPNVIKFSDIDFIDVLNQINSFSLFEKEKIIVFDLYFLINKFSEKEIDFLIKNLDKKTSSILIIFKLNKKINNKMVDYLKNNAKSYEFNELKSEELTNFIKNKIKEQEADISDIDLIYFLSKLPNKLSIIMSELNKLITIDKNISKFNIDEIVQYHKISNVFEFINSFYEKNCDKLFKIYYEKINFGESIQSLMGQISSVLDNCSRIYSLLKLNYSIEKIEKIINKHSFVIKKNIELLNLFGYKKIYKYLNILSELDENIKQGKIDEKIGFERFLLEVIK